MALKEGEGEGQIGAKKDFLTAKDLGGRLRASMFVAATENWNNYFDPKRMEELLLDPFGNHEALRSVRKAGLVLRTAHFLFADEPMPAPAHKVVKAIGTQNDWINLSGEPNGEPILEAVRAFTPSDQKPTLVNDNDYLERINANAVFIRSVASAKNADPNTFHKMRTSLKHFLNIYRMIELMPGAHSSTMLVRTYALNELLGQMHDGALQIVDGVVKYSTPSIRINAELKQVILEVVREIVPA